MGRGISLYTIAGIVVIALNATGAIELPWALVLAPLWVPALMAVSLALFVMVLASMLFVLGAD